MDNTKHPESRETAAQAVVALEKRMHALERKLIGMPPAAAGTDVQGASASEAGDGVSGGRLASHTAQLAALSAGMSSQRDKLRDVEQALVERIADVDDDRRRTASALQRALHTQREEHEALTRRRAWFMAGGLVLCIVLSVSALVLGFRPTQEGDAPPPGELAQIQEELARVVAASAEDDPLRGRLTGLTEAVSDISSSLEELTARQQRDMRAAFDAERAHRQEVESGLGGKLQRLDEAQRRIDGEIASLRAALAAASAVAHGPGAPGVKPAPPVQTQPRNGSESQQGLLSAGPAEDAPPVVGTSAGDGHGPLAVPATPARGSAPVQPVVAVSEPGMEPAEPPEPVAPEDQPEASGAISPVPQGESAEADVQLDSVPPAAGGGESLVEVGEMVTVGAPSYAIQLIGFYSLESLREFANRDDMPARVFYRRETLRGKPWFVLIHSLHEDIASAAAERFRLPPDLAALDLWIRPFQQGTELEVLEPSRDE